MLISSMSSPHDILHFTAFLNLEDRVVKDPSKLRPIDQNYRIIASSQLDIAF